MTTAPTPSTGHAAGIDSAFMPQLDGLRAIAVMAVLVHHYLRLGTAGTVAGLEPGLLGVRLFFVLSGFLITGILLRARQTVEQGLASRREVLQQFYIRRALRIFPLYYGVLLAAWVFGSAEARDQLPWLASYSYNFWIAQLGWYPAHFSHFWSLAVEEQFYLLWPAAILLVPRRALLPFLLAVIVAAPLYRALAWNLSLPSLWFYVATPSALDALGMGALLAVMAQGQAPAKRLARALLPLGALALLGCVLLQHQPAAAAVFTETLVSLLFMTLVAAAGAGAHGAGPRGVAGRLLEARPLQYLGKISYGVYVYHLFLPDVARALLAPMGITPPLQGTAHFLVYTAATIAVASLSWHAFERPLNALKSRYAVPSPADAVVVRTP